MGTATIHNAIYKIDPTLDPPIECWYSFRSITATSSAPSMKVAF
jgi:hypothetical protein